eukprot:SAG11_NODE_786_length_7172_cov_3.635939_3_plen_577_part_00
MAELTDEERWGFDVKGFLHLRGALSEAEQVQCRRLARMSLEQEEPGVRNPASLDAALNGHLVVRRCLSLLGPAPSQERPWQLVNETDGSGLGAHSRTVPRAGTPGRSYRVTHQLQQREKSPAGIGGGLMFSDALVVVVALSSSTADEKGGLVCVPASHKSTVPAPPELLSGLDDFSQHGEPLVVIPALSAGDMLVMCSSLLRGFRPWDARPQRLLEAEFLASDAASARAFARLSAPADDGSSAQASWTEGMTDEVKAVLGLELSPGAGPPPLLVVGEQGRAEVPSIVLEPRHAAFRSERHHPSLYLTPAAVTPSPSICPREFFFFDLTGYLVVRGLGSPELIARANRAIDACAHLITGGVGQHKDNAYGTGGSAKLSGRTRMTLVQLLKLPHPHNLVFREMVAHAGVVQRLLWMQGAGFKANLGLAICSEAGCAGQTLHGNPFASPGRSYAEYTQQNGRVYTGSVNVAWALHSVTDTSESGDGGFVVVPGSHKAAFDMPSTDPADTAEQHKGVVHPLMQPGDCVFFMGGATAHGAWRNNNPEKSRRVALFNYLSKDIAGAVTGGDGLLHQPPRAAL